MMHSVFSLLTTALLASYVNAHGTVDSVSVGNTQYMGYPPTNPPGSMPNPAKGVVWASNDWELGFVLPEDYANDNIICHKNASPAPKAAAINAGESISMSWPTWPESDPHPGAFVNYLAPAGTDDPTKIDKSTLKFFKISEFGYDSTVEVNGEDKGLATGSFKRAGRVSQVQIPANIKPGLYVLRHEIIALHQAESPNGAQNYPQCITIKVSGSGTLAPEGIPATQFYKADAPGILVKNFYYQWDPKAYIIPGPAVYDGSSNPTVPVNVPVSGVDTVMNDDAPVDLGSSPDKSSNVSSDNGYGGSQTSSINVNDSPVRSPSPIRESVPSSSPVVSAVSVVPPHSSAVANARSSAVARSRVKIPVSAMSASASVASTFSTSVSASDASTFSMSVYSTTSSSNIPSSGTVSSASASVKPSSRPRRFQEIADRLGWSYYKHETLG